MHVNTLKNVSTTYTIDELQDAIETGKLDKTKITDISVFNKSVDESAVKDGKDDGKIGFFEGLKETVKGTAKGLVNGIKGMFTDEDGNFSLKQTLKSAAIGASCFIPGVGPFIAGGLCAYGAVKGATGIAKGVAAAANAETDAEKRAAFQSIGANGVTTGLSVAGLKGSAAALKGNLKSAGVTSLKNIAKGEGGKLSNVANNLTGNYYKGTWSGAGGGLKGTKALAGKGLSGTADNLASAGKLVRDNAKEKISTFKQNVSEKIKGKSAKANEVLELPDKSIETGVENVETVADTAAKNGKFDKIKAAVNKKLNPAKGKLGDVKKGVQKKYNKAKEGVSDKLYQPNATGVKFANPTAALAGTTALYTNDVSEDMENQIYFANQTYADVTSQTGYEYDLQDYNTITQEALDKRYSQIMFNANAAY